MYILLYSVKYCVEYIFSLINQVKFDYETCLTLVTSTIMQPVQKHTGAFKSFEALKSLDYGRIEWQRKNLAKAPDMAYQDILDEFDAMWYVRGLIVTTCTQHVTWNIKPQMV